MKIKDMPGWQKKKFLFCFFFYVIIAVVFLSITLTMLATDKIGEDDYWDSAVNPTGEVIEAAQAMSTKHGAVDVTVGTYVENLRDISLGDNNFSLEALVWFKWNGDPALNMAENFVVYKGKINERTTLKNYSKGGENYQLVRLDVTITKNYWNRRFPLESHQLKMYIESDYEAEKVRFIDDKENSGINHSLGISGFTLRRSGTAAMAYKYDNNRGDPEVKGEDLMYFEHCTALEINRDGMGLYIKCFVALFGTTVWVLIALYICTNHHVDPLSMMPGALFGTISNIMIGANLLPDALQAGLLEFVNIWGVFTIIAVTIVIININRVRNKHKEKEFAKTLGRVMFYTILIGTLLAHILLPLFAFSFK